MGSPATLGLAFTEVKDYISYSSDSSNANYSGPGGAILSQDGTRLAPRLWIRHLRDARQGHYQALCSLA